MQPGAHGRTDAEGYAPEMRLLSLQLHVEGNSRRAIGRIPKIGQQTVVNWIDEYVDELPPAPLPDKPQDAELDELCTFLGRKKTKSTSQR